MHSPSKKQNGVQHNRQFSMFYLMVALYDESLRSNSFCISLLPSTFPFLFLIPPFTLLLGCCARPAQAARAAGSPLMTFTGALANALAPRFP